MIIAIRHIGSAFASIADLYMTDLWYVFILFFYLFFYSDESDAEENCENALRDALIVDKDNIDAL